MIPEKLLSITKLAKWLLNQFAGLIVMSTVMALTLQAVGCTGQPGAQGTPTLIATQQAKAVAVLATTAAATTRPTLKPTIKPSLAPTVKPKTVVPTKRPPTPTAEPTVAPTDEPTSEPTATKEVVRPYTHIIKETGAQGAAGELTINNNSQYDGLAILATYELPNSPIASGVIRTGESLTINQIPDGIYRLFFCTGTDWLTEMNQFDTVINYQKFEDAFEYTTSESEYTSWDVTLAPVAAGNASSEPVNPEDFPPAN